jgi:hypothetical protein
MEERHGPLPAAAEHLDERRRRDHRRLPGQPPALRVARRRPAPQRSAPDEPGLAVDDDEDAVREIGRRQLMALGEPLLVQLPSRQAIQRRVAQRRRIRPPTS